MITREDIMNAFTEYVLEQHHEDAWEQQDGIEQSVAEEHGISRADVITVFVPALFWDDHIARECEDATHGVNVQSVEHMRYTANGDEWVAVIMERAAIMELISDARHYSSGYDEEDYGDLMESARLTRDALLAQSPLSLFGVSPQ